jgi:hypothetical protein
MELFAKITDSFSIEGRGLVVTIEFISQTLKVRVGDKARLKTPDGRTSETNIRGVEFGCGPNSRGITAFLLSPETTKADVPQDTEVWLFPEEQAPRPGPQ